MIVFLYVSVCISKMNEGDPLFKKMPAISDPYPVVVVDDIVVVKQEGEDASVQLMDNLEEVRFFAKSERAGVGFKYQTRLSR